MTHEIDDAAIDQEADTGSVWELRGKIEALETENARLRAELAAEREAHERTLAASRNNFDMWEMLKSDYDAKCAELAAAREAIKDAYFEGWGDAHECGNDRCDWSKSWAKRVYECARIDALKGDGDE